MTEKRQDSRKEKDIETIKLSLQKTYETLTEKQTRQISHELAFAPQTRKINIGGQKITASDLRYQVADTIENMQSSKDGTKAQDLQMMMASSIETLNSETNSVQEYFRWLDDTSNILKNMNDGYVSEDDLKERNDFLDMSHQREAELMTCLALYASSNHPMAAEKAALLRYKLTKLREMRSAIETRTRNEADVKISKPEYEMALPYYKLYKGLSRMPFGHDFSEEQKNQLGINHNNDPDLQKNFNHVDRFLNDILDDMQDDGSAYFYQENQKVKRVPPINLQIKKKEISDKMKELTGRRQTFLINYTSLEKKKAQLQNS